MQTRAVLEGLVARRAAERIDHAGAATLRAIVGDMRAASEADDFVRYSQANARFHQAMLEFAEHETAAKLLALLHSQSVRYQFRTVQAPGRPAKSLSEHEEILAALVARDPEGAERAVRAHLQAVIETVRAYATARFFP